MPNIMIHEEVGNYIAKKANIKSYDYFLGLLAPDAPNLNGFAPKEERWNAHLRRKDLNDWRIALLDFYNEENNNYPDDFLTGYFIHVLTDIVYDDFLYLKVRERIIADNYPVENSHDIMSKDMQKYYFEDIEDIKNILNRNTKSYTIRNISSDEMLKWKEKQVNLFQTTNTSHYFTDDIINKLNELVYKEFMELLSSLRKETKVKH